MFLTLALALQFITNGYPLKCICQFLVAASEHDYAFDASLMNALKKKKKTSEVWFSRNNLRL